MTMTDNTNPLDQSQESGMSPADELALLKQQATMMNIPFSNNIKVDSLRAKIAAKMDEKPDNTDAEGNALPSPATNPLAGAPAAEATPVAALLEQATAPAVQKTLAQVLKDQALRLVRIRISSMDPKKQDLEGEIFTVANEYIGTIKKHVPFGEKTDKGYHVPYCIYELLKSREFLHVQTREVNGQLQTKTRYVKEFAIELLPDLTVAELKALAADQRATGRLEAEDE